MRFVKWTLAAAGLAVAAACKGSDGGTNPPNPPPSAVTINLTLVNAVAAYSPAVDTLAVGGTASFVWDTDTHDVTSYGDPGFIGVDSHTGVQTVQRIFNNAGTYRFLCTNHGTNPTPTTCSGMCGVLVVR